MRFMNMQRARSEGGGLLLKFLLGAVGVIGVFVSLGLALLISASQEKQRTKLEWWILMGIIFISLTLCLLLAVRQTKRRH